MGVKAMFKRLSILFFALTFAFGAVSAQYLVVKKNPHGCIMPLDENDAKKWNQVFAVLKKYTWPMCLAHLHELTPQEKSLLFELGVQAEEAFLRTQLQKIDQSCDIVFVPTTLYEVMVLYFHTQKNIDLGSCVYLEHDIGKVCQNVDYTMRDIRKVYASKNDEFKDVYFLCNQMITICLCQLQKQARIKTLPDYIVAKVQELVKNFLHNMTLANITRRDSLDKEDHIDFIPEVLQKIVELEFVSHKEQKILLFRGTDCITQSFGNAKQNASYLLPDSPFIVEHNADHAEYNTRILLENACRSYSLSYSNSALGGIIYDGWQDGACAYLYMLTRSLGYAFSLSKKDCIEQKLFFISPLGRLPALSASGETWHSRSIACIQNITDGYDGFADRTLHPGSEGFLAQTGSKLEYAYKFFEMMLKSFRVLSCNSDVIDLNKLQSGMRCMMDYLQKLVAYQQNYLQTQARESGKRKQNQRVMTQQEQEEEQKFSVTQSSKKQKTCEVSNGSVKEKSIKKTKK